jgi:hypothetical protein
LGVVLDSTGGTDVDWGEIAAFVEDAYRTVSPKHLTTELDDH